MSHPKMSLLENSENLSPEEEIQRNLLYLAYDHGIKLKPTPAMVKYLKKQLATPSDLNCGEKCNCLYKIRLMTFVNDQGLMKNDFAFCITVMMNLFKCTNRPTL